MSIQSDGTIAYMSQAELDYRNSQGQIQWVTEAGIPTPYWYGSRVYDISKCGLRDNFDVNRC